MKIVRHVPKDRESSAVQRNMSNAMARTTLRPLFAALRASTIAPVSAVRALEAQSYSEIENENERETLIPPASVARRLVSATL